MKTLCLNYGAQKLKISNLRYLTQYAQTIGMSTYYDDDLYRGYINPIAAGDVLSDVTFDRMIDVVYLDAPRKEVSYTMRLAGIRFMQTTTINAIYLFGRNSDPFDVQTLYLEQDGKIVNSSGSGI